MAKIIASRMMISKQQSGELILQVSKEPPLINFTAVTSTSSETPLIVVDAS